MSTWFTADQHFGDRKIIGLCRRPFASVQEQDDEQVARWNTVVAPQDEVWVLGDVALDPLQESLQRIQELKGIKRLVVGNHDEPFEHPAGSAEHDQAVRRYLAAGFTSVHNRLARIQLAGQQVLLSHFPVQLAYFEPVDRYAGHRPDDDGSIIIHGHVHDDDWLMRTTRCGTRQIHVGVDVHAFTPVPAARILQLIARRPSHLVPTRAAGDTDLRRY